MMKVKTRRVQEGFIHVYIRGNNRFRVFYDDEDCIVFLLKCDRFARKHNTKILEYALMINHVHLLIQTDVLSVFVRELLQNYSAWYNVKYKHSNKIFKTPFSSSEKRSEDWILQNSMYILQNPVRARLALRVEDYKWSSVRCHFPQEETKARMLSRSKCNNLPSKQYLSVDTSFIDSCFSNRAHFLSYVNQVFKTVADAKIQGLYWEKTSSAELAKMMQDYIKPRTLNELSSIEREQLIRYLIQNSHSALIHIASLVHENYDYVRKLARRDY